MRPIFVMPKDDCWDFEHNYTAEDFQNSWDNIHIVPAVILRRGNSENQPIPTHTTKPTTKKRLPKIVVM